MIRLNCFEKKISTYCTTNLNLLTNIFLGAMALGGTVSGVYLIRKVVLLKEINLLTFRQGVAFCLMGSISVGLVVYKMAEERMRGVPLEDSVYDEVHYDYNLRFGTGCKDRCFVAIGRTGLFTMRNRKSIGNILVTSIALAIIVCGINLLSKALVGREIKNLTLARLSISSFQVASICAVILSLKLVGTCVDISDENDVVDERFPDRDIRKVDELLYNGNIPKHEKLRIATFARAPKPIDIKAIKVPNSVLPIELVGMYRNCEDSNEIDVLEFEEWITRTVLDRTKYTHMPQACTGIAVVELTQLLKGIAFYLRQQSQERRVQCLTALIDASRVCSPTWLEVALGQYTALADGKKFDSKAAAVQSLLRRVQNFKEEVIKQKMIDPAEQWHELNYFRFVAGDSLGLNKTLDNRDSCFVRNGINIAVERRRIIRLFLNYYNEEEMVVAITESLNKEQDGENQIGIDQSILQLLQSCLMEGEVSEEEDEGEFLLNKYYTICGTTSQGQTKYQIESNAVEDMLRKIGVLV